LIKTLLALRDLGNSVIVVEHDEEMIRQADFIIDMGPEAGEHGGHIVALGSPDTIIANPDSLTGQYLSGQRVIDIGQPRPNTPQQPRITLQGCRGHNLKNID